MFCCSIFPSISHKFTGSVLCDDSDIVTFSSWMTCSHPYQNFVIGSVYRPRYFHYATMYPHLKGIESGQQWFCNCPRFCSIGECRPDISRVPHSSTLYSGSIIDTFECTCGLAFSERPQCCEIPIRVLKFDTQFWKLQFMSLFQRLVISVTCLLFRKYV